MDSPVTLQVTITPPVNGPLQYQVYVKGARLTQCPTDSPVCQWTASAPGEYAFHAIVRPPALGRGGRGSAEPIDGPRFILTVQAPPVAIPTQTPTAPDTTPDNVAPLPELIVKLLSPKVVAGESARFSVSLVNASPLEYVIDMGDGKTLTKTDAEFTYTYAQPGTATIVASYPVSSPIARGSLNVTIEIAPPPPPIALQLRAVPDDIRAGESITFQVSTPDGRPITAYSFDPGDGSAPRTLTSDTFVALYSRPGQYLAAVSPAAGQAGAPATARIVVSPAFPRIWIYAVIGIVGVAVVVWVFKRPPPTRAPSRPSASHAPPVPAATFHPHPDDALRFKPSKGKGIALEVHYVPNLVSLSYTPRVRISEEQS